MTATELAGLVIAAAIALGVPAAATHGFRAATTDQARMLAVSEQPVALVPLALQTPNGIRVPLADPTRITIADLIYTRCPTLCVQLSSTFIGLQQEITRRGLGDRVRLLTITFDPAADSLPVLAEFATMHGVQPAIWDVARPDDASALRQLQHALGLKVLADGRGGFVHNAALHLIDTGGRLVAIVPIDEPIAALDLALKANP